MSFASTFHAAALARAMRHAGDTFVFGGVEFSGTLGTPKPDDPRLQGAADRAQILTVVAAEAAVKLAGVGLPKSGDIVTRKADSADFLVSRRDTPADGSLQFLVTKS